MKSLRVVLPYRIGPNWTEAAPDLVPQVPSPLRLAPSQRRVHSRRLRSEVLDFQGFSFFGASGPQPGSFCERAGLSNVGRSVYVTSTMATRTGFDRFLDEKLRDDAFREEFESARAEVAATDSLVRALEGARASRGVSKAELARRISAKPEIVRRLLTDTGGNPTLGTVLKVATALDCHLELVPNRGRRAAPAPQAARQARAATEAPTAARVTGTRPRAGARARSRAR